MKIVDVDIVAIIRERQTGKEVHFKTEFNDLYVREGEIRLPKMALPFPEDGEELGIEDTGKMVWFDFSGQLGDNDDGIVVDGKKYVSVDHVMKVLDDNTTLDVNRFGGCPDEVIRDVTVVKKELNAMFGSEET